MTDLEISKALALAIGWEQALLSSQGIVVQTHREHDRVKSNGRWLCHWRIFDYRDWNVIGPIAERYNAFPYIDPCTDKWEGYVARLGIDKAPLVWADTPQKAIALAVIGAKK